MMWWGLAIGAVLVLALMNSPAEAAISPDNSPEWLARVVLLEAGDIGPGDEWAAIMQVGINRRAKPSYGDTLRSVVATTEWPGGGARGRAFVEAVQAPGGQGYRSEYGHIAPPDHPRWRDALAMSVEVLRGYRHNIIGDRTHFFHPGGMPRCDRDGEWNPERTRICHDGRWWPVWAASGFSEFPPIRVGRAVFS